MTDPHPYDRPSAAREVSTSISSAHLFIYLAPELEAAAAELGVTDRGTRYFAFRAAALGAVPWQVAQAVFYNFSPRAAQALDGAWNVASPEQWQAARFAAAERAMRRVGVPLSTADIAEARTLVDPVVAAADLALKPMAAANAAVPLPSDPLLALWQQLTVLREWRGDAHFALLAARDVGPCDCNVLHTASGRLPLPIVRVTRKWNDDEWAAATDRLARRGWLHADGTITDAGQAAREQIEVDTDEACTRLWSPLGDEGTRRLAALIRPIGAAFAAAGDYQLATPSGSS